jgi:hypothetical protein
LPYIADKAFRDFLKKHHRLVTLRDALRESARMHPDSPNLRASASRLVRTE